MEGIVRNGKDHRGAEYWSVYASSFKGSDLIKGGMQALAPAKVEGERSVSGSVFAQRSAAVDLTDTITLGGGCHCFAHTETDPETRLWSDS